MPKSLTLSKDYVYLSLGEEVLPLIKRGMVPLRKAEDFGFLWFRPVPAKSKPLSARVSEADYLAHLQAEYARLPATLRGLLTEAAFIQQAEKKRSDIEAALLKQQHTQKVEQIGNVNEWLMQRFYTDAFSLVSWQAGGGFGRIWLVLDPSQWPDVTLREVSYSRTFPPSYPKRLLTEHLELGHMREMRIVQSIKATEKVMEIQGKQQGLVRLPPKAIRSVLFGADVNPIFLKTFSRYWKQDFRYQRIPMARMMPLQEEVAWVFEVLE